MKMPFINQNVGKIAAYLGNIDKKPLGGNKANLWMNCGSNGFDGFEEENDIVDFDEEAKKLFEKLNLDFNEDESGNLEFGYDSQPNCVW